MRKNAGAFGITLLTAALLTPLWAAKTIVVPSQTAGTITQAFLKAKPGDTVLVKDGIYREKIFVKSGVILKAETPAHAILDGGSKGVVVTLGRNSEIWGFTVTNGTIGIFSKHPGCVVRQCRVIRNWQTGLICVRHLPRIENNVIAFNRGSGIQGWDVRSKSNEIAVTHNVIAYNGNNGVAMGGKSEFLLESNTIAHNVRLGVKLLKDAETVTVVGNNFYGNLPVIGGLPHGNYSYDPQFASPRKLLDFTSGAREGCKECPPDKIPGLNARGGSLHRYSN